MQCLSKLPPVVCSQWNVCSTEVCEGWVYEAHLTDLYLFSLGKRMCPTPMQEQKAWVQLQETCSSVDSPRLRLERRPESNDLQDSSASASGAR